MRNPARDEADRWTTALGVPAGTEPEDAVRMVTERERAAVVAYLREIARKVGAEAADIESVKIDQAEAIHTVADWIQRGEHVRVQTTHPDPSSAADE